MKIRVDLKENSYLVRVRTEGTIRVFRGKKKDKF